MEVKETPREDRTQLTDFWTDHNNCGETGPGDEKYKDLDPN